MLHWLTGWRRYWTLGTILALGGAAFVRFGVSHLPPSARLWGAIVGVTLATIGLAMIPFGTKKRADQRSPLPPPSCPAPSSSPPPPSPPLPPASA